MTAKLHTISQDVLVWASLLTGIVHLVGCNRTNPAPPLPNPDHVQSEILIEPVVVRTMFDEFAGVWELEAYGYVDAKVPFDGDLPKKGALEEWLYAAGNEGLSDLKPQNGLQLTIQPDGKYSEVKTLAEMRVLWFDSEGVQEETPQATVGTICAISARKGYFLHPANDSSSNFRTRAADKDAFRYDDGDTLICDSLRIEGDSLIRVMSVATDEIYLSRIVCKYVRAQ